MQILISLRFGHLLDAVFFSYFLHCYEFNFIMTERSWYVAFYTGVWTFLYFVGFCYLADGWRKNYNETFWGKSEVEAAIAFSFFSFGVFVSCDIKLLFVLLEY